MTTAELHVNAPEAASLLAYKFNETLPSTAGSDLTDGITITGSGRVAYLNLSFSSNISAVLNITRTVNSVTKTQILNGGTAVSAGELFRDTIMVAPGELINITYGGTGGTYQLIIGAVVQNG